MQAFLVLLVAYTLSQFYRSFLAVIAADLTRDLGLDAAELGTVSAAWFVAFAAAQFPVGIALDRLGPRWTLAGLHIAAVVGAYWLSRATGYADCVVAMALIGIGCAPALMAAMYVFARAHAPQRFALLSSTIIGFGTLGNLAGATPLALAVAHFGWRPSILIIAALSAASAALVALLLRDPPRLAPGERLAVALRGVGHVMGLRSLWLLLPITAVSYAVVIATRSLWIAPFLQSVYGLDVTGRGNAALAMALAMVVGALAYGPLERVFGCKPVVLGGVVATGLAFLALGCWGDRSLVVAVLLLAAVGAFGMSYAVLMAHARAFFPSALIGRGVTFMNFVFIAGAGAVQWLSGLFIQASGDAGSPSTLTFERLHLAFGAALLATAALYLFAPVRPGSGPSRLSPARQGVAP